MAIAQSKLTSQGQISVPAEIRKRLGVGPGSTIEWDEQGDQIVVRRVKKYTSQDIHKALFPEGPPRRRTLKQLKEGIEQYIREQHARGQY
jgi:AbrB family looped-hinge helix DNA binding protein